ncbi:alkyl sulfatase BDS1-like metallo-beta-lactamase superfamily hydrolase [Kitasatospora sp. GAS204A]|nr:alkyl sulfatase BDS1-like metallo-beta-lactamase superfamily hydrolase [Kitasatospora sp. GAS204B]
MAGGARSLTDAARRYADAGELRLAGHLAELAVQAAPQDTAPHAVRAEINQARAEAESSLMARGIFSWAAAESRRLSGGDGPAQGPAAGLLGTGNQ